MAYQELTQFNSPNYTPGSQVPAVYGMARAVEGVTYHWWGSNADFMSIVNYLCRANGNTSAHTVGEAGRVAWIVDAVNAAWHAGNARGNATTVGYECNTRLSDGDYETMGEFHYDMEKAYGRRLNIYVHKEWFNTSCSPIDKNRIRVIADRYHAGGGSRPTVNETQIREVFRSLLGREVDPGGLQHYLAQAAKGWSIDQIRADVNNSQEAHQRRAELARQAEVLKRSEWVCNLRDIEDVKLVVAPAAGLRVVNMVTMEAFGNVIPKGTVIDIAKETVVQGKKYYLSQYAVRNNKPFGIAATELVAPADPNKDKPAWQKNLKDIADQDFWTRSECEVIDLTTGKLAKKLPMGTKVRVTHVTKLVDDDLMVLEGGTLAIDKLYLSDKPIDSLEKRVSALEAIVNKIIEFLTNLFKNFNK